MMLLSYLFVEKGYVTGYEIGANRLIKFFGLRNFKGEIITEYRGYFNNNIYEYGVYFYPINFSFMITININLIYTKCIIIDFGSFKRYKLNKRLAKTL